MVAAHAVGPGRGTSSVVLFGSGDGSRGGTGAGGYRATGRNGRWVVPDWSAVRAITDGVHLSVAGYLSTAGRAVPVEDDVATVLAGWDADATFWLTDARPDPASRARWARDGDVRAPAAS